MGFKDYLTADTAVFFNTDEFAETYDIDGNEIPAILDYDTLKNQSGTLDGVYRKEVVLYVLESDLGYRPVVGNHMKINGDLHLVNKCVVNAGLLEITLEANEA